MPVALDALGWTVICIRQWRQDVGVTLHDYTSVLLRRGYRLNMSEIRGEIKKIRPSAAVDTVVSAIGARVAMRAGIANGKVQRYLNGRLSAELADEVRIYTADLSEDGLLFLLNSVLWWATKGKMWLLLSMVDQCFPLEAEIGEYKMLYRVCREQGVSILVHDIAREMLKAVGVNQYQGQELEVKISECIEVVVAARDIQRCELLDPF